MAKRERQAKIRAKCPRMIEPGVAYNDDEQKATEYRKNYWVGTFVPSLFTERIYIPKMSEENGKAFLEGYGRDVLPRLKTKPADFPNSKHQQPDQDFIEEHNP